MRRLLVIGGSGRLGVALARRLPAAGFELEAPSRASLDVSVEPDLAGRIAACHPDAVIHAAAYNDVDAAERPEFAERVRALNVDGPARLAAACRAHSVPMVHLSTDYVFDGRLDRPYREEDPTGPLQEYGRSKLEGERAVSDAHPGCWVVRTSTLFGPLPQGSHHYVERIRTALSSAGNVEVVRPPVASPTSTFDLADALGALVRKAKPGLYHVVNAGGCSRLELARETARLCGHDERRVTERPAAGGATGRPARCMLDPTRFVEATGHRMRSWREALADYLKEDRS